MINDKTLFEIPVLLALYVWSCWLSWCPEKIIFHQTSLNGWPRRFLNSVGWIELNIFQMKCLKSNVDCVFYKTFVATKVHVFVLQLNAWPWLVTKEYIIWQLFGVSFLLTRQIASDVIRIDWRRYSNVNISFSPLQWHLCPISFDWVAVL